MNENLWEKCVKFHGHECPGLAIGYKACEAVRSKMKLEFSKDEEIVCITENDACGLDAIQLITGCTIGKGNLIYKGTGKHAYSFFNRQSKEKVRLVLKPFKNEMDRKERQEYILKADIEDLFEFKIPKYDLPDKARIFSNVECEICNENAPEHKIRMMDGKKVCLDCFEDYSRGW